MTKLKSKNQVKRLNIFLLFVILAMNFSCGMWRQMELDRNRQLWQESGIINYKMRIELQKTGHAAPSGKFIVTTRNGKTESIKLADKPEVEIKDTRFSKFFTLEGIFDYIKSIEKETWSWNRREVEYDSKLGYPKKVNLDAAGVLDEELFFQVLEFETLQ